MIDFVEAYENSVNHELPDWIKVSFLAGLVYLSYYFYSTSQTMLFYCVGGVTAYLLLVLMLCVINNVRGCQNFVLPKLKSPQMYKYAATAIISIVPLLAFFGWAGWKIFTLDIFSDIFSEFPEIVPVCKVIVWTIFTGISVLAIMLFGKSANPLSVLDFKNISKYSMDVIPHLIMIVLVVGLGNGIVVGLSSYVFILFLSLQHPGFIALCSFAIVISVIWVGNCLAQLEYEIVQREEEEHVI